MWNARQDFPESFRRSELLWASPQACRECHPDEYAEWSGTYHALANRLVDPTLDRGAFSLSQVNQSSSKSSGPRYDAGRLIFDGEGTLVGDEKYAHYEAVGVIGVSPLRQYLIGRAGGRFQVHSLSYDSRTGEWFNVFGDEKRKPWEWGHWNQQGMNWNANCASCHMTDFKKNYDAESDRYDSDWLHQGIGCVQCHSGMETHVASARGGLEETYSEDSEPVVIMENCASCHSRREELTADGFSAGERFNDHFRLALPDQSSLYFANGQVQEEVYTYGSLRLSRMGHAGVTCVDCHHPHTLRTLFPVENNALCQRCHGTGELDAPRIDPMLHSNHPAESVGNRCVECHMPETVFMQRDSRRDHGFTRPDPQLTVELGIPNACNRCHFDMSAEWAAKWAETWYGESDSHAAVRQRTRAVARAYSGDVDVWEDLLRLARKETLANWRATLDGLLLPWAARSEIRDHLYGELNHREPLVRSAAVRALAEVPEATSRLRQRLKDSSRLVRLDAAWAMIGHGPLSEDSEAALEEYLKVNADRPLGALRLAEASLRRGEPGAAREWIDHALKFDRRNPDLLRQSAIMLVRSGDRAAAERLLLGAKGVAPSNAAVAYALGLFYAEDGRFSEAIRHLEDTVRSDPAFQRAWYNLALAHTKIRGWGAARSAIEAARRHGPDTPEILYTHGIILTNLGEVERGQALIEQARSGGGP